MEHMPTSFPLGDGGPRSHTSTSYMRSAIVFVVYDVQRLLYLFVVAVIDGRPTTHDLQYAPRITNHETGQYDNAVNYHHILRFMVVQCANTSH